MSERSDIPRPPGAEQQQRGRAQQTAQTPSEPRKTTNPPVMVQVPDGRRAFVVYVWMYLFSMAAMFAAGLGLGVLVL